MIGEISKIEAMSSEEREIAHVNASRSKCVKPDKLTLKKLNK